MKIKNKTSQNHRFDVVLAAVTLEAHLVWLREELCKELRFVERLFWCTDSDGVTYFQ